MIQPLFLTEVCLFVLKWVLLFPFAFLFMLLVRLKNGLYALGLLKQQQLEKPVISVGNLSFGGTGKSPMVAELAGLLVARGLRVAILSRGYGRRNPKSVRRVDPHGDWRDFGDEPFMLARRLPDVQVCVGPSRFAAAQALVGEVDVFLIDDGFQHRQLKRDFDVVLIDLTQPFPTWLPPQPFRETVSSLGRADAVVLTRWQQDQDTSVWERRLQGSLAQQPILKAGFKPQGLFKLNGEALDLALLRGQEVGWFAAIAHPQKFANTLVSLGVKPRLSLGLMDHEEVKAADLRTFAEDCRKQGVSWIVTTEKDAAKLDPQLDFAIVIVFLTIDVFWEDSDRTTTMLSQWLGAADFIR
jgi:tetraacyldisaccharide 4'-kinase